MLPTGVRSGEVGERPLRRLRRLLPAAVVAGWALGTYAGLGLVRSIDLPPELSYFAVQPLIWLSLAGVAFAAWLLGLRGRPHTGPELALSGLLVGAFQVAFWLLAGLAFGFGSSAFARSPMALVGNLLHMGTALLALELSRTVLVVGVTRNPAAAVLGTSLFVTWLRVPPARWAAVAQTQAAGPFLGEMLLPYFAEDLLASWLALVGGPLPALLYRGALQGFWWFSPILPQLPWTASAFIGTLAPALGLVLLQTRRGAAAPPTRHDLSGAWPLVGTAVVALLWFNVGLFGVRPTLISGGSMEPALRAGDVAVVRQVPPDEIGVGDIVQFRHEGVHVVHRVAELRQGAEGLEIVTKGDANNRLDPPIPVERLDGKVVFVIRKLGWIGIALRRAVQWVR